jgi:hypothetical protein
LAQAAAAGRQRRISGGKSGLLDTELILFAPTVYTDMAGLSLQSIVAQGCVEVLCGVNVGTYCGGLNAESRPHGFGGK